MGLKKDVKEVVVKFFIYKERREREGARTRTRRVGKVKERVIKAGSAYLQYSSA